MLYKKIAIILCGFLFGSIFNFFNIPAGWLLGALFAGILFSITFGSVEKTPIIFKIGLAIIGTGIGINIDTSFFVSIKNYILPLFISIPLTILFSVLLAEVLFKKSNLDYKTSLFSCIPGGASEVIAMSKEVGANEQIVAAFHTVRILLFVLTIPIIVGTTRDYHSASINAIATDLLPLNVYEIFSILIIIFISIYLSKLIKAPIGTLIYAMLLGFLVNQFMNLEDFSTFLPIIGQVIIGSIIGQKFDIATAKQLKQIGFAVVKTIVLLFGFSLGIALIFSLISHLSYASSLLGTVPAGAAEMSSTAFALNLDPSIIVALQTIRLLTIFLLLPFLISYAENREIKLRGR